jgi:hypothetical protein
LRRAGYNWPNEEDRLSKLVFKALAYSIDKSDTNHNPGWLLLYLNRIHPALAKLLSPNTLMNCSGMIMSYLRPRYNLDSQDAPQLFEDLKYNDKFKYLPIHKKILLYELKVANDMSNGYISKDNASHNILLYLLNEVPFSSIGNKPDRFTKQAEEQVIKEEITADGIKDASSGFFNEDTPYETFANDDASLNDVDLNGNKSTPEPFYIDYTISEEFDNTMHFLDDTYKKEKEVKEPSNLYYAYGENLPLIPKEKEDDTDDLETVSKGDGSAISLSDTAYNEEEKSTDNEITATPFVTNDETVMTSFTTIEDTVRYPVSNPTYIGVVSNSDVTRFEQFVIHVKEREELTHTSFEERIDSFKKTEYSGDSSSSNSRAIEEEPQEVLQVKPNPIVKTDDNYDTRNQE